MKIVPKLVSAFIQPLIETSVPPRIAWISRSIRSKGPVNLLEVGGRRSRVAASVIRA